MIVWKTIGFKADPNKVYQEILNIGASASPQSIVDAARDESSELHKCFDWNDATAAESWRRQQARLIVCNLVYTRSSTDDTPTEVRVIESVSRETYKPSVMIIQNDNEYKQVLDRALSELRAWENRYSYIKELVPIIEKIEGASKATA